MRTKKGKLSLELDDVQELSEQVKELAITGKQINPEQSSKSRNVAAVAAASQSSASVAPSFPLIIHLSIFSNCNAATAAKSAE